MTLQDLVIAPARRLPDVEVPRNLGYIGCVSYHYLHRLGRLETPGIRKIFIEVLPPYLFAGSNFQNALGVLTGFAELDLRGCADLENKIERKRQVLETLHRTMQMLATEHGWDRGQLEHAQQGVVADNLQYVGSVFQKPMWNKSRTTKVDVKFTLDLDGIRAFVVVDDTSGNSRREIELFQMGPNLGRLRDWISNVRWIGEHQIQISSNPTYNDLDEANNVLLLGEAAPGDGYQYRLGPAVKYESVLSADDEGRRIHRLTLTL